MVINIDVSSACQEQGTGSALQLHPLSSLVSWCKVIVFNKITMCICFTYNIMQCMCKRQTCFKQEPN